MAVTSKYLLAEQVMDMLKGGGGALTREKQSGYPEDTAVS